MPTRARWILGVVATAACRSGSPDPPPAFELERGGVYVAYNLGCEEGCRDMARGDVILAVDGEVVDTRDELIAMNLTDERAVELQVLRHGEDAPRSVTIRARPGEDMPPLQGTPPFWTVGAAALDRAPDWARAPMFSHAMPALGLVSIDGGWITGRDLYGRKVLMVVWPDMPMFENQYRSFREEMSTFHRVLQRAQYDLGTQGVGIIFAVCGGANDTTVRDELEKMNELVNGEPLDPLPVYRCPGMRGSGWASTPGYGVQAFGDNPARHVGLENSAQSFFDYVRGFPVVVVVDAGGIVRWHSSGYHTGPQTTILKAVMFALEELELHPA